MDYPTEVNPNIILALQRCLAAPAAETKSIINKGMQAYLSSICLEEITRRTHGSVSQHFLEFCQEYLALYPHCRYNAKVPSIQYFEICSDASVEGVLFEVDVFNKVATVYRLKGICGVTTKHRVKEIIYV